MIRSHKANSEYYSRCTRIPHIRILRCVRRKCRRCRRFENFRRCRSCRRRTTRVRRRCRIGRHTIDPVGSWDLPITSRSPTSNLDPGGKLGTNSPRPHLCMGFASLPSWTTSCLEGMLQLQSISPLIYTCIDFVLYLEFPEWFGCSLCAPASMHFITTWKIDLITSCLIRLLTTERSDMLKPWSFLLSLYVITTASGNGVIAGCIIWTNWNDF